MYRYCKECGGVNDQPERVLCLDCESNILGEIAHRNGLDFNEGSEDEKGDRY